MTLTRTRAAGAGALATLTLAAACAVTTGVSNPAGDSGMSGHAPIRPASSDPDFGLGLPGFAVRYREG